MISKHLDSLRGYSGAFSSVKQMRRRITNMASGFLSEKMCKVMLKKPFSSNLVVALEVLGE